MSETSTKAIYYFQSYQDYFWQWEIDYMFLGNVIENAQDYQSGVNYISIPDGMTIAYREQLEEVLQVISSNDLPPFGALILTFLATNSGEVGFAIDEIFTKIKDAFEDELVFKHVNFEEAQRFLKTLISLPASYKKGKNRMDLFAFLFQDTNHGLSSKYSPEILTYIKNKEFELNQCSQKVEITMSALSKDFNTLALMHERYPTTDALLKAWGKMVDVEADPEDTEIDYYSDNPDLIQELIEEPKTFFMGSLIKRLWSGINLPMHYVQPGEMPLGGISDVTNKGNFDNLLISEFANDDLIFLHRIANKEALFIRRETTPEEDLRTRIFLIDTTIKSWGTPKILSFATAFSFIHHPKNEMNFQAFAVGNSYKTIHFDSKLNIIEGLQITSPVLDAADAITQFIENCEEENVEITLFTSPKTLAHASIRKVFNIHHDKFGGIITADIYGNIDVYKMKNGAKRLAKHIQLPLEELWAHPPRKKHQKQTQSREESENDIVVNYPVLYGHLQRTVVNFSDENYAYMLQKNGDLYKTYDFHKGFEMIQRGITFVAGIKQRMYAVLWEDEVMVLYWNAAHHMVFKTEFNTYVIKEDLREYEKVAIKVLIVYEEDVYLVTKATYNYEPVFTRFDIYEETYKELQTPSRALIVQYENYITHHIGYFEGSIFSKINQIIITKDLQIIFNRKHQLSFYENYLSLELLSSEKKRTLKDEYTIHFHKRNSMVNFDNGCQIKIDKNGVIIFESTIPNIPTFYVTSWIGVGLAMATEDEFAGNTYFLPKNSTATEISASAFYKKYVEPFLINILNL